MAVVNVETDSEVSKVSKVSFGEVIKDPEDAKAVRLPDGPPGDATGYDALSVHNGVTPNRVFGTPSVDITAPVTVAVFDPESPGDGGTYTVPLVVELEATDPGNSGIDTTEYRFGTSGPWLEYSAPFEYEDDGDNGSYTLQFRSTDNNGNVEETKSVTYDVDIPA